jgi:hypothetical protein
MPVKGPLRRLGAFLLVLLPAACTPLEPDNSSLGVGSAEDADGGRDAGVVETSTDGPTDRGAPPADASSDRSSDGGACCGDATSDVQTGAPDVATGEPDVEAGEPIPDAEAGTPDANYYVDVAALSGGDGTLAHPFQTITAALDRTSADAADGGATGKRIYVFSGTYTADTGERFPLTLRHGETVTGAGQDRTTVMGAGDLDHAPAGGSLNGRYRLTVVLGSHYLSTRLAGMTIRPVSPTPIAGIHGILCDQGSKTVGETTLDSVAIGPGYDDSILAGTTTRPFVSACQLRLTASRITGAWAGLFASGCADGEGTAWVDVQVGAAAAGTGNVFQWMNSQTGGAGALTHPCVTGAFRNNQFLDSANGIFVDARGQTTTSAFQVVGNRFERLSLAGIDVEGNTAKIDDLSDNVFTANGNALSLIGSGAGPASVKARRNQFVGNDLGVYIFNATPIAYSAAAPIIDFGWQEDGGNTFRCNSSAAGGTMDVAVYTGSGTIPFQGNFWDHAPPIALPYGTPAASIDIETDGTITLDTARAAVSPLACPAGRAP